MGCFLGCFGLSCKRKRRKPANRVLPRHQLRICSYEPLDSASVNLGGTWEPKSLDSEIKEKGKESFNGKVRKKVSFNLNVQTYEPIPKEESSDEEREEGKSSAAAAADFASYPSDYRYRNCIDCYDEEEDETAYDESDLDDEDEDDFEDEDEDFECMRTSREDEVTEKFESLSVNRDSLTENLNEEGTTRDIRDRKQYVHSVLKPVENMSQWKAVKTKAMGPTKRQRKENVETPLISAKSTSKLTPVLQEVAVDASLSNWLGSAEPCLLKSSCNSAENMSEFERNCQWRRGKEAVV